MRLLYTPAAKRDVDSCFEYICDKLHNRTAASAIVRNIVKDCALLKKDPFLGMSMRSKFGLETDYRYLVVGENHLAFYVVVNQEIHIVRILDSRTDYMSKLF